MFLRMLRSISKVYSNFVRTPPRVVVCGKRATVCTVTSQLLHASGVRYSALPSSSSSTAEFATGELRRLREPPVVFCSHDIPAVALASAHSCACDATKTLFLNGATVNGQGVLQLPSKSLETHKSSPQMEPSAAANDLRYSARTVTELNFARLLSLYMQLSKVRLSGLVVVTAMGGYLLSPDAFDLSTFLLCCLGTAGMSACANSINQVLEVPYDCQMKRTQNRVLVRGHLRPLHAVSFGVFVGLSSLCILSFGVNAITAGLGLLNCVLYTIVYTPLKRVSIVNTWIGSVVGAIPPLMGWAACSGTLDPGAFVVAALLYVWQFPHFNALSWNLRSDYSRAGYRMASVTHPALCRRVALRHSVAALLLCSAAAPLTELTTWMFALESLPFNLYLIWLSGRFYQDADSGSSRKLFRYSLLYLPIVLILMLLNKNYAAAKKIQQGRTKSVP